MSRCGDLYLGSDRTELFCLAFMLGRLRLYRLTLMAMMAVNNAQQDALGPVEHPTRLCVWRPVAQEVVDTGSLYSATASMCQAVGAAVCIGSTSNRASAWFQLRQS